MNDKLTKIALIITRLFVIGFFTFAYGLPLYVLFYLIIFQGAELLSEISIKCFSICYFMAFVMNYVNMTNGIKKDEIPKI
jgi:hypothetical protein